MADVTDQIRQQITDWESEVVAAEREARLHRFRAAIATATASGREAKAADLRAYIEHLKAL